MIKFISGLIGFAVPSWGLAAAALVFGISVLGGAYFKGRTDANANCNAASLQLKIDILERDAEIIKRAAKFEEEAAAEIAGETERLEKERADYAATLQQRPACALDAGDIDADARRLR